jgi:type IV pilus assembly protein PilB
VRKICKECKTQYSLPEDSPERIFLNVGSEVEVTLYAGKGCPQCDNTGYRGRVGIYEIMPITSKQRDLILTKATADDIKKSAIDQSMITLKEDGIAKAYAGLTTLQEVMRVAYADEV